MTFLAICLWVVLGLSFLGMLARVYQAAKNPKEGGLWASIYVLFSLPAMGVILWAALVISSL